MFLLNTNNLYTIIWFQVTISWNDNHLFAHSYMVSSIHIQCKEFVDSYMVTGAKINFDKSEGLRLGAWRGGVPLPGPFHWSDGPIHILRVWFGPRLQLEGNWTEVQAKVNAQVGTWLWRHLPLRGRAGQRCAPCTSSPWSFTGCLYFLCLRTIVWHFKDPSPR